MQDKEYIENVLKTESCDFEGIRQRLSDEKTIRALHAALGAVTEAGELADVFKKHIFYGKSIDWVNLKEEAGDLFWYMGVLADILGETFEAIKATNIAKLAKRYPDQVFTEDSAINRDTKVERLILEEPTNPFQDLMDKVEEQIETGKELQSLVR